MCTRALAGRAASVIAFFGITLCGWLAPALRADAQTQIAVEYYYVDWNFYFVTAFPDEIAALDGGAFGGAWKRTGQTFYVWTGPTGGALPTCRFFSVIFAPKSSHFYTPYADECASLKSGAAWQYEAIAFYLLLPDANGQCPPGTVILFRLYNNGVGGAPNHRFVTDVAAFNAMRAEGWTFEGNGLTGAFACVPSGQVIPSDAQGFWDGTTNANESVDGVVLDDGTFYFFYSAADNSYVGLIQGSSSAANGQFSSSGAKDFRFLNSVSDASITAMYVPKMSFGGTKMSGFGSASFATTYDSTFEQPASLSAAAGTYTGFLVSMHSLQNMVVTLSAAGTVSGSSPVCSLTGTAAPHGTINAVDISLILSGPLCPFATAAPVTGVLFYDPSSGETLIVTVNTARTDAVLFAGSK